MKKEHDEFLCAAFPKMFKDRNASMQKTAMCWGFECGDGWFPIIKGLCYAIQGHIDHRNDEIARIKKWNKMVADGGKPEYWKEEHGLPSMKKLPSAVPQVVVTQVKEKFGTLRFYYDGGDDAIQNYVTLAEYMSGFMCDECSASTETDNSKGWVYTRCESCQNNREQARAEEANA